MGPLRIVHDIQEAGPASVTTRTGIVLPRTAFSSRKNGFLPGNQALAGKGLRGRNQPSRLLIRTASNAYFPQVVSVLSLPDRRSAVATAVAELWEDLQIVEGPGELAILKRKPRVAAKLSPFSDADVLSAIAEAKGGKAGERAVKEVELEAILAAPEGFGDDVPVDPDFHARRIPERTWRRSGRFEGIEAVVQLMEHGGAP
jgi:hypothetical protein